MHRHLTFLLLSYDPTIASHPLLQRTLELQGKPWRFAHSRTLRSTETVLWRWLRKPFPDAGNTYPPTAWYGLVSSLAARVRLGYVPCRTRTDARFRSRDIVVGPFPSP